MYLDRKIHLFPSLGIGSLLLSFLLPVAQADIGPAMAGVSARTNNATSVFFSPAGITKIEKPELILQASLVAMDSKFIVEETNRLGGNADSDFKLLPVPGMYYARPLKDRWTAGFSVTAPGGFGNNYGKTWSGRYLAQETELAFMALTGTLAYEISDQWSIGGGPIIMYTQSVSMARVNNLVGEDGRIKLKEDGFGIGWQLGLTFDISDNTRIGAVYRSEVDPNLSGKPEFRNVGPLLEEILRAEGLWEQSIDVDFRVPQSVQAGILQDFGNDWSFTLDGAWFDASEFGVTQVSIGEGSTSFPAEFQDVWAVMVGLRHQHRPDLAYSFGAAYVSSAASEIKRTLALPIDRSLAFGVGLEWQWKGFEVHGSLNYANLGKARIDQDGGPAGRVKGSFAGRNNAFILDTQFIKRF